MACKRGHDPMRRGAGGRCLDCRRTENQARRADPDYQARERRYAADRRTSPGYDAQRERDRVRQNERYASDLDFREACKRRSLEAKASILADTVRAEDFKAAQQAYQRDHRAKPDVRAARSEYTKRWAQRNRDKRAARQKLREQTQTQACPRWLTHEQKVEMAAMYSRAREIADATGVPNHVDHIVPLRGRHVSGLHVPWNLQVLPAVENLSKGNRCAG
jgi:hypothetical protein